MIDAPYTGAHVRYDNFSETASIGPMDFMGYSDPAMEGKMDTKPAEPTLMLTNPYTIGLAVGVLQTALNRHGAKLTVDGIFGPLTEAAVKIFQKVRGLVPDGIVGPVTWSKLS
jgi:peptidoglycan hydrolase-like protein with peptidoglycan-binding domain